MSIWVTYETVAIYTYSNLVSSISTYIIHCLLCILIILLLILLLVNKGISLESIYSSSIFDCQRTFLFLYKQHYVKQALPTTYTDNI
jgi:hypothetical protein